jgi:hypothetical protein
MVDTKYWEQIAGGYQAPNKRVHNGSVKVGASAQE